VSGASNYRALRAPRADRSRTLRLTPRRNPLLARTARRCWCETGTALTDGYDLPCTAERFDQLERELSYENRGIRRQRAVAALLCVVIALVFLPAGGSRAASAPIPSVVASGTVGRSTTPGAHGGPSSYSLASSDGGIFAFGNAGYFGSMGGKSLVRPIAGMSATPDGGGYWLVASDGGIFAFGNAGYFGSTGAVALNRPIVGMSATPDGGGYWLVASDGGIFAFGNAGYFGSTGAVALNRPIVGMSATHSTSPPPPTTYCGTKSGAPLTTKVMIIFEENRDASSIYGSSAAPNLNTYAADCGSAQNYQSLTHPSLPNYLASTSGLSYASLPWPSTDCDPSVGCSTDNNNIFNQVGASGWTSYVESMTSNCQRTSSGTYTARHNPAAYYTDVSAQCQTNDVPMGTTSSGSLHTDVVNGTLPTVSAVTPNLVDDMHDGTIQRGDSWLAGWISQIVAGPDYRSGHLVVLIMWDEGSGNDNVSSMVPMIALSPYIVPGTTSSTLFTHFSLLAAAEGVAGVPTLADAAGANSLRQAFGF
jgi:hypothetical protein